MTLLYSYLLSVCAVLCVCITKTFLVRHRETPSPYHSDDKSLFDKMIPYLLVSFGWPIVTIALLIDKVFFRQHYVADEEPFSVKPSDITFFLTREDIERDAIIDDPLMAVPAIPFGHLHAQWLSFMATVEAEDQLARFIATREVWGNTTQYVGIVCVRADVPGLFFLTDIFS